MRRIVGILLLVAVASTGGLGATYSTYYDCTPGRTTVLVITNASDIATQGAYALRLYDPKGSLIGEASGDLGAFESATIFLADLIEAPDGLSWGLVRIESPLLLQTAVWIGELDQWISVINTVRSPVSLSDLGIARYWYSINFASTEQRTSAFSLINPGKEVVSGTVYIYDQTGASVNASQFVLEPREIAYFIPEDPADEERSFWGLIDVQVTGPILLVGEYFGADEALVDVEVGDTPYYLEQ